MPENHLISRGGAAIEESAVQEFENSLRGELIRPRDPGYEEARKVHNAMIDKYPGLIVYCLGVADVVAAVNFARAKDAPVAVRGAGHNVAGTSLCDGGIVIDLSRMKGVRTNVEAQTVRVEPGLTWAEVNHELQIFNLAATGGFVGTTGVSGLTLGGGLGWLVRKHGLALDNLMEADVVTADGHLLTASSSQNADLFWGIRGGGGNFGIVTSFKFQAHPVGVVLAGLVMHPLAVGKEALRFWRDYEATVPEEFTAGALLFNAPPDLPLPDVLRNEPIVALGGVYTGPLGSGEKELRPLREFGPPTADIFQPMPYNAAQTMADFLWPPGSHNYWKSSFLKELSDDAVETILAFFRKAPSSRTVVVIEHNGGAMSRVGEEETSFGHRNWPYNFLITSVWSNPAESEANIRWTKQFFEAMQPFLADAGYVNYLGEVGDDRVMRSAYGTAKYERLVSLKTKYDPTNLFRMNQNIRPGG